MSETKIRLIRVENKKDENYVCYDFLICNCHLLIDVDMTTRKIIDAYLYDEERMWNREEYKVELIK